jgi:hypothetical protein
MACSPELDPVTVRVLPAQDLGMEAYNEAQEAQLGADHPQAPGRGSDVVRRQDDLRGLDFGARPRCGITRTSASFLSANRD